MEQRRRRRPSLLKVEAAAVAEEVAEQVPR